MRCAAVGLAALAAAASAVQGLNVTDVLTYSLVCTTRLHKHGRQCLEYTHHDREAQHKVRANYTKGELRTPRYRWNVYLWTTEEGEEKVKIEKDGSDIDELRLDEPYCAIRDTTNNAGKMSLEPCKINGTKGDVVDLLEDSWNARVVNSKDKSGNPHFEILSPNKQNCLVANLDNEGNSGYLFAMVGECGTDDSIWIARDFISTAHPTMSPISPTYRPTFENTEEPEDAVPTLGPTVAPSSEVKDIVPRRAFLLREGISGDNSALGFGISRGDDHEAVKGDKLQLKSFTKLQNKDDVHVTKMMWYMDKAGLIHFGAQPELVLVDKSPHKQFTDKVMASFKSFVELKPESEVSPKESVWEMVPRKGAFRIRRKALEEDDTEMCLTVAECNLKDSGSGTHWICQDRGNNPACTENECDEPNCSGEDCLCNQFPDRTCRKLEPGAYVKVMKCSSTYDAVQLFNTIDANEWLTPNTRTQSPSVAAPTPAPSTKPPTTKPPTPVPTSKPTVAKTSPPVAFGSRETDPESSGSAPTIVLLALVGLVGLMVLLVRRKSNDRPYTGRRANSFGGPMDDDDDQGLFDSFDNLNNGLYSQPSSGGSPQRNNTDNAGPSARERMMQGSGGGLQEVPMTHFEQDQGYVARV